ncbi:MAG: UDP-glucose 4-epimerase GalE [Fidelibacterota bacterium]
MKILVTGGAGYIGAHIAHDLCEAGHDVIVLDDLSLGREENIPAEARFIKGSTHDSSQLQDILQDGVRAVMHFAAWKAAGESMTDPGKYAANNISGTLNLLNAMIATDVKIIVFSSTAAVYGYPDYLPVDEDHPTKPINYYGYTKLAIEQNLTWYSQLKGLRFAALRYFNAAGYDIRGRVRGKEHRPQNLLPVVMEVAAGVRAGMQVFGDDYDTPDGTGVRDYIHVNDLATAHLKALDYLLTEAKDLTVNLATGQGYSVLDVIGETRKVTGRPVPYEIVARRPGDPAELVATSKRALDLLDWEPEYSDLNTLLKSMWDIYKPS